MQADENFHFSSIPPQLSKNFSTFQRGLCFVENHFTCSLENELQWRDIAQDTSSRAHPTRNYYTIFKCLTSLQVSRTLLYFGLYMIINIAVGHIVSLNRHCGLLSPSQSLRRCIWCRGTEQSIQEASVPKGFIKSWRRRDVYLTPWISKNCYVIPRCWCVLGVGGINWYCVVCSLGHLLTRCRPAQHQSLFNMRACEHCCLACAAYIAVLNYWRDKRIICGKMKLEIDSRSKRACWLSAYHFLEVLYVIISILNWRRR